MNTHDPNPAPPSALEPYLDGTLEGADLEAFEAALGADPSLAAEVALQRRIDGALRRCFAPPAALRPETAPPPARSAARYWTLPRLAAAAAIVLLVGGVTVFGLASYFAAEDPLVRVYRGEVARGLTPAWVCDTDEQLVAYLQEKYGRGLTVRRDGGGTNVQLVGWTSCSALSPYTAVLMTRVEGEPVLVLVDHAASDRDLHLPWLSGLHLFKRTLGGWVLYELTPRAHPALLDRFAEPPQRG